jgi:hypothetical protein
VNWCLEQLVARDHSSKEQVSRLRYRHADAGPELLIRVSDVVHLAKVDHAEDRAIFERVAPLDCKDMVHRTRRTARTIMNPTPTAKRSRAQHGRS